MLFFKKLSDSSSEHTESTTVTAALFVVIFYLPKDDHRVQFKYISYKIDEHSSQLQIVK